MLNKTEIFLNIAKELSKTSTDKSTKVGAILVKKGCIISSGVNKFNKNLIDEPDRHERPMKYLYTEHAERNAIYNAAKLGIPTRGAIMYVTHFPCWDCARAVIEAGIIKVIVADGKIQGKKYSNIKDHEAIKDFLQECNVQLIKEK